jgi:hypothetical protein
MKRLLDGSGVDIAQLRHQLEAVELSDTVCDDVI